MLLYILLMGIVTTTSPLLISMLVGYLMQKYIWDKEDKTVRLLDLLMFSRNV